MELGHSKQYSDESGPYSRQGQCTSRQIEQTQNSSHRMDSEQNGCSSDISEVGVSNSRPVCITHEQADRGVLLMDDRFQGSSNRRSVNSMARHVSCMLIPPFVSFRKCYNTSRFKCQMILIAPHWPRRHWYTKILELLIACPIMLPVIPDLLYKPKSLINHPNPEIFKLTAWFLSTDSLKREVFLNKLENCSVHHGEKVHKKIMYQNSKSLVAGAIQGKLIPILQI